MIYYYYDDDDDDDDDDVRLRIHQFCRYFYIFK